MGEKGYGIVSVVVECAFCRENNYFKADEIDTYDGYIVDKETLKPKRCSQCGNRLYK